MENKKEIECKLSHVNSIIDVLKGNAWVGEKNAYGSIEFALEHDTKNRMLITMIKYRDALQEELKIWL